MTAWQSPSVHLLFVYFLAIPWMGFPQHEGQRGRRAAVTTNQPTDRGIVSPPLSLPHVHTLYVRVVVTARCTTVLVNRSRRKVSWRWLL